jgi:hypothetical protein
MSTTPSDKKQIGLTAAGNAALAQLIDSGLFANESDAYKLGIAYALAKECDPNDAPEKGYTTKFNAAGGIDVYHHVSDLVTTLRPQDATRPYATAERLAELGLTEIARRLEAHETLAKILGEFEAQAAET